MSDYQYEHLYFICRAQPFHNGHLKVIETALQKAKRVGILIGSANSPRTLRNPFTYDERVGMIKRTFDGHEGLDFTPLNDYTYNDAAWIKATQQAMVNLSWQYTTGENYKQGLIGHSKDNSSYYLKLFPNLGSINVPQKVIYNATDIRNSYFTRNPHIHEHVMPSWTAVFLKGFCETQEFANLVKEREYIVNYRKSWDNSPYPPTFVTTDAVVTQSGHILMIERKALPGKGLLALPGGFLDNNETILDGIIRELREETNLKVPEPVLRGSLKKVKAYDDPNRSERGRVITHVHHFNLEPQLELPKIKAGSDAGKACWMPIGAVRPQFMFEDHYHIVNNILELT